MKNCQEKHLFRKWLGVFFLLIEMNLLGGTIFGFPAIFQILSKMEIYKNVCQSTETNQCLEQMKQYQVILFKEKFSFDIVFQRMH